jgi:Zn finger protein HypA/HybF involved in hydrogenase expression
MRMDNYDRRKCSICRREYETTDSESKICPLCRADELRYKAQKSINKTS